MASRTPVPFELLVKNGPSGIFHCREDGACTYINPALEAIMELPLEQALGSGWTKRLHPDDKAWMLRAWTYSAETHTSFETECRLLLPNNDIKYVRVSAKPISTEDEQSSGFVGYITDITQQTLYRSQLAQTEAWSKAILEQSRVPMAVRGLDKFTIDFVNPAFTRTFGYRREDIPNIDAWHERAYPDSEYRDHVLALWSQQWQTLQADSNAAIAVEVKITCKDGQEKWALLSPFIVYTAQGEQYASSLQDITELRNAQAKVKDREERFALAVKGSGVGIWDWDIKTDRVYYSTELKRELGYNDEEFPDRLDSFFNHLHPDDIATVQQNLRDHLSKRHIPYRVQYRMRHKGGHYEWYEAVGEALKHDNGIAHRMAGSHTNISERIATTEKLNLANMVFENSGEAIVVTDGNGIVVMVNPAFSLITGYEANDVLGKNIIALKSTRNKPGALGQFLKACQEKGSWSGELWCESKLGQDIAIMTTTNSIKDEHGEIIKFIAAFNDVTDQKHTQELIWQQAHYDSLTQLLNRNSFTQYLNNAVTMDMPFALLFIDLDHFKQVNDTLGHKTGDELLKMAADRIRHCVRGSDIVSRFGGDEFTVILSSMNQVTQIKRICHEVLHQLARPFKLDGEIAYISASIGITQFPQDSTQVEDLYKFADQAMYDAKHAGRNRYAFFTHELQQRAEAQRKISADLRVALERHQFSVVYQPIINLQDGIIEKAEALIRWQHPELGYVSPGDFIPVAEDNGLIIEIGDWVFKQAAMQAKIWQKFHNPKFQVSINKSPVQFYNGDHRIQENWSQFLKTINLSGSSITVEITEGLLLDSVAVVKDKLTDFHDSGMQISLDDFGTGYSALSYLKKFKIDYIKIDQSFVRNIENDAYDYILCETIISMSHKLGKKVIAEGIESDNQMRMLMEAGCDYGQGYLFSKPIPADSLTDLLIRQGQDAS